MMKKTKIGTVSVEEKDEIERLYERKIALSELYKTVATDGTMNLESYTVYDRVIKDMGSAIARFNRWWIEMRDKYGWADIPGMRWEIDFSTCDVFLVGEVGLECTETDCPHHK